MKRKKLLIAAVGFALCVGASGCGPLVTSGPDVMVGGGIYPAPYLNPPMGNPNAFRPGGPNGPGFSPGPPPFNRPGGRPSFNPGNNPGNIPGNNPGLPPGGGGGNNRVPGTGIGGGNPGGPPP